MTELKLKECTICNGHKELHHFYAHPSAIDGRQSLCKLCQKVAAKRRYQQNRGKILAQRKAKYMVDKYKPQ